jgi:uncharacterized protein YbaA (DUF1428 family)
VMCVVRRLSAAWGRPLESEAEQPRTANADGLLASLLQSVQLTLGETVVFSWIVSQSRTHRAWGNAE